MTDGWLGLSAAALTTLSGLPQLVRALRTRSAGDLSLITLLMLTVGVALWLVYGLRIGSFPLVLANALSLVIYLALTGARLAYGKPRTVEPE